MSGHIFFADRYYGFDDALYAAIRIINIVQKSPKKLSQLRKELPKTFSTPEIRIECADEKKFKIIENLKNNFRGLKKEFNDIDGLRVTSKEGWWLLRASNTQAALVARCEAKSSSDLEILKKDLRSNLEFCDLKSPAELA
jgi:phosphomannomutase